MKVHILATGEAGPVSGVCRLVKAALRQLFACSLDEVITEIEVSDNGILASIERTT